MWLPTSQWYPVAKYLATWMPPEYWNGVKPHLEDIRKALDMLEPNVPTAHREAAGCMPWMSLAMLWQASLEVQSLAQQVQQLKHQEEALERWLVAAECMLQGLDRSLPLFQSGSPPATLWQVWPVILQHVEKKNSCWPQRASLRHSPGLKAYFRDSVYPHPTPGFEETGAAESQGGCCGFGMMEPKGLNCLRKR